METVTQSLAGRTAVAHLLPCEHKELLEFPNAPDSLFDTIQSGAFPAIFDRNISPIDWYRGYITTTLDRDVRQILNVTDLGAFQTFLELVAGQTGQLTNLAQIGADAGVTANTAKSWISVLETGFLVFRLRPCHANLKSRLIKTPKLYFYDTGLACALLGITNQSQLVNHPLRGALFENWVVTEILKARFNRGLSPASFFFRDRKGFEIDLIVDLGDRLLATEIKSGQTVSGDYFSNLERLLAFKSTAFDRGKIEARVVFGGTQAQKRREIDVVPWNKVKDLDWW